MKTLKLKKLDDSQMRNIKGGDLKEYCSALLDELYNMHSLDDESIIDAFEKNNCHIYLR